MINITGDRTLCCSNTCEKRFECGMSAINNIGMHCVEDFSSFGSATYTDNGCEIEHCCGEKGDYKMFEPIDKSCSGCVYEDADGSTVAISNCVCCSRNVPFSKNDNYRKK